MRVGDKMNTKKISISIITILLLINIILVPKTFAMSDIIGQGKGFLEKGEGGDEVINATTLGEINSEIYNVLLVCGIGVAVIVGAILGITFIISSAEGKAKISETLVPYIVGCFVVFGAFTIWKIVVNIGNSVESSIEVEEVACTYKEEEGKFCCNICGSALNYEDVCNGNAKCNTCNKPVKELESTTYTIKEDGNYYCDYCTKKIPKETVHGVSMCLSCHRHLKSK